MSCPSAPLVLSTLLSVLHVRVHGSKLIETVVMVQCCTRFRGLTAILAKSEPVTILVSAVLAEVTGQE